MTGYIFFILWISIQLVFGTEQPGPSRGIPKCAEMESSDDNIADDTGGWSEETKPLLKVSSNKQKTTLNPALFGPRKINDVFPPRQTLL